MWQDKNNQLYREFTFKDFDQAWAFMTEVAKVCQRMNHHPRWLNEWNKVQFWLYTHSAGGVSEQDHALAKEIDEVHERLHEGWKQMPADNKITEVKVYSDGGSRGNPGPSAGGFAVLDMQGNSLFENGKYLGITTNNQAEYHSIKGGLEAALAMGARTVHVFMDSMLVINQLKGVYKIKNQDLWPIHQAIMDLIPKFEHVDFTHVPREMNRLADSLVNKTLDDEARK